MATSKYKDFTGFRYGNIHTKDLNLVVVVSGDRYEKNLLPSPKDYTVEIPGGNGNYYFGQTFENRTFTCNIAFDSITEENWRQISQIFSIDKPQDLVFDELPYKTYKAKIKSKPEFKYICFTNRKTNTRVYKGEATLEFVCYSPFAFGFDKYIVRAADYYKNTPPETIIKVSSKKEHSYANNIIESLNKGTKDFYNVKNNMNTPWKGGFPTIEQVSNGELFFNSPNGERSIIDVRGYWDNVPEWAPSSKLLTTPTLDYDQELIYLPQYSKTDYINMDIGMNNTQSIIGSRMLVYNPGDLPIDFNLRLDHVFRTFNNSRGQRFQIRRLNVERLTIQEAVDWTGLKTQDINENKPYKYGNRYFKKSGLLDLNNENQTDLNNLVFDFNCNPLVDATPGSSVEGQLKKQSKLFDFDNEKTDFQLLNDCHPNHTYIVEPIPKEKLGHYIRLFYWQNSVILKKCGIRYTIKIVNNKAELRYLDTIDYKHKFDDNSDEFAEDIFEVGIKLSKRYEELYEKCITEKEKNELYWSTLKSSILDFYKQTYKNLFTIEAPSNPLHNLSEKERKLFISYEEFCYNFIHHPAEFIRKNSKLNYGEIDFNINEYPQFITEDYLEIDTKDIDLKNGEILYLDSEKRMLYDIEKPERRTGYNMLTPKKLLYNTEYYNYTPKKRILNEAITKGQWFQIPTGWSIIEVIPVVEDDNWGGKRWIDARPFDWGYGGNDSSNDISVSNQKVVQQTFNYCYYAAVKKFLKDVKGIDINMPYTPEERAAADKQLNLRHWFDEIYNSIKAITVVPQFDNDKKNNFIYGLYRSKENEYELYLLKLIQYYWGLLKGKRFKNSITNGKMRKQIGNQENLYSLLEEEIYEVKGEISEWWWYACNYIWELFPPTYWTSVDLLNSLKIKYVPLFY